MLFRKYSNSSNFNIILHATFNIAPFAFVNKTVDSFKVQNILITFILVLNMVFVRHIHMVLVLLVLNIIEYISTLGLIIWSTNIIKN